MPAMCQPPAATGPPASGLCYSPLNATAPSDTPLPPFLSAFNTPDYWCARHTWLRVLKSASQTGNIFSGLHISRAFLGEMDGWMGKDFHVFYASFHSCRCSARTHFNKVARCIVKTTLQNKLNQTHMFLVHRNLCHSLQIAVYFVQICSNVQFHAAA